MSFDWKPYVPVAERRRLAAREATKLRQQGIVMSPAVVPGRRLASTFWGKAWGDNLESYSDYANRLPRGRTYLRNGSVVDLQVKGGTIEARVMGSQLYHVQVKVAPLAEERWRAICQDCAGSVDSMVELLQGRMSQAVAERVCRQKTGLFPSPREITLSCSCPDWATLCKHVAAVLYGVGARFDERPELAFELRTVDPAELVAHAAQDRVLTTRAAASAKVLEEDDLGALFGLEMADAGAEVAPVVPAEAAPGPARGRRATAPARLPARMTVIRKSPPAAGRKKR